VRRRSSPPPATSRAGCINFETRAGRRRCRHCPDVRARRAQQRRHHRYAFAIGRSEHAGRTTWGHGGADAGFRSITLHFPAERLGIVVLSNAAPTNPTALARAVADVYLDAAQHVAAAQQPQVPTAAAPQSPPSRWQPVEAALRDFTGDYYSPELGTFYSVQLRDDALSIEHPRLGGGRMQPGDAEDAFRAVGRSIRFERIDGVVTGFRLSGSRVRNVRFIRMQEGQLPSF
jgi:hypothetical protein